MGCRRHFVQAGMRFSANFPEGSIVKRLSLFLALLVSTAALAETTRYVTDQLEITLRSGQSTKHQILRMLRSGTPLEVLETDAESGYSRVRAPDGSEGWVITRYLDPVPSGRERLAAAQRQLAALKKDNARLAGEVRRLGAEKDELTAQLGKLRRASKKLEQELERIRKTSASALAIDNENKSLKTRLQRLEQEHKVVQEENERLRDRTARDWFMAGAGVILLGMGIGLVIPKIRWRRKSNWSSL